MSMLLFTLIGDGSCKGGGSHGAGDDANFLIIFFFGNVTKLDELGTDAPRIFFFYV